MTKHIYNGKGLMNKIGMGLSVLALSSMFLYSCESDRSKLENKVSKSNKTYSISNKVDSETVTKKLTSLNSNLKLRNPLLPQIVLTDIFTYKVYDDQFNSIGNADERVAKELYSYNLEELVDMKAITTSNIYQIDLWLPLGLKSGKIDFYTGMSDSWDDKLHRFSSKLWPEQKSKLNQEKKESLNKMRWNTTKSSLRRYREEEIAKGIDLLKELSINYLKKNYLSESVQDVEMRRFISNVQTNLSANVLLGYNIHELLPPTLGKEKINAVAKTYFIDQLLSKGGKEFIARYPARYDILMSYGPFQLTKYALGEIENQKINSYTSKEHQSPKTVAELETLQDHVNAAVEFAFANWITLGESLRKNSLLKRFNDGFEDMDARGQKILLAGITACMHHLPADTRRGVINYVTNKKMDNMYFDLRGSLSPQLNKYYQSSGEAYLVMKVFDVLDDRYGK
jgi:hypothetical protein